MKYDYDVLVIGGGAAGLTAAGMGANFGAKTLLVESQQLGGDCTWHGCIPSKTLLHASKLAYTVQEAEQYGLTISQEMDFRKVMEKVRTKREEVYKEADHPDIYRQMGADVLQGEAQFLDAHTIAVRGDQGEQKISSQYIIIATGSYPFIPPVPGLEDVPYHTNESIFEVTKQPQDLAILGAGPIGIELAQAFQRLGTNVTVFDQKSRILSQDDEELAELLLEHLKQEGVTFSLSTQVSHVSHPTGEIKKQGEKAAQGNIKIQYESDKGPSEMVADALLVATGRAPNTSSLNLDRADINYTEKGISVDERCRTNQKHIFAVGDVTGRYQFTHMSEHMAKTAVTNALLKVPKKIDAGHVPWNTFTDPELAHVGATEKELQGKDTSYKVYRFPYHKIDRAITDEATEGLIKVFAKKVNGKILGATIYGKQAGDLISEYALAMRNGVTLRNIADTIHPYPTYGLGIRRAADQWYIKNQSSWMIKILQWLFGYQGRIPDLSDEDRIV